MGYSDWANSLKKQGTNTPTVKKSTGYSGWKQELRNQKQAEAQTAISKFQSFVTEYNSFIESGGASGAKPLYNGAGKLMVAPETATKAFNSYQSQVKSFKNRAQELQTELKKYSSYYNADYVKDLNSALEKVSTAKPLNIDEYTHTYYNPARAKGYSQDALIQLKNDIKFSQETTVPENASLKEKFEAAKKNESAVKKNNGSQNPYVSGNGSIDRTEWLDNYKFVLSQMDENELSAELSAINGTKATDGLNDARLAVKQAIALKDNIRFSEKYKDSLKDAGYNDVQKIIADLKLQQRSIPNITEKEKIGREISWLKSAGENLITLEDAQTELDKTKNENGYTNNEYWQSKVYNLKYADIVSKLDADVIESAKDYKGAVKFVSQYNSVDQANADALSKIKNLGYSEKEAKNIIEYIQTQEETDKNKAKLEKIKTNYNNQNGWGKTALVASTVATNLVGMVPTAAGTIFNMYKEIFSSEYVPVNVYANEYQISNMGRAIRNSLSEDIGNEAVDFLAQTGLSIVDWLAVTALTMGAGQALGMSATAASNTALGIMGTNAGANTALDTLEKGGNYTQAGAAGILAAATEILTEKIALDSWASILTEKTGVKNIIIKSLIQQGFSEAGEETLAQVANFVIDAVVMGDESDYQKNIQAFIDKGYDETTARSKAILALGGQVALAGLGGFLSGAAIGSSTSFIVNASNNFALSTTGKNIIANNKVDSLINIAEKYNIETKLESNNSKTVGKVWNETKQAIVKEMQNIDENGTAQVVRALTNEQTVIHSTEELAADMEQLDSFVIQSDVATINTDNTAIEADAEQSAKIENSKNIDKNNVMDNATADMPEQEANSAIEVDGNVFFTDETDSAFTEPSASSPKDATPLQRALGEMYGNPVLTEDQKTIKSIGKKLGWKILFDNVYVKDAQGNKVLDKMNRPIRANADIDFKNRTVTIDFNCKKPIQFLFKHELTHFGETSELYQDFVDAIRTSSVYLEWLQAKTGNNVNSVGKLEGVYRDMVIESRKSVAPVGITEAQQEMYADFCGDVLFSNNQNALNRLMDSLDKKERPKFIQFILDFITYLKEKIAGNKQITLELVKLENQFAKMLNDAKENTDQKGGVRYQISDNVTVDMSEEERYEILKDKKIQPQEIEMVKKIFGRKRNRKDN